MIRILRIVPFFVFPFFVLHVANAGAQEKDVDPAHAAKMAKGLKLFKTEVKPVFVGRCLKCHGGEDTAGEFDLSDRKALLAGGDTGPAIVIGKSKQSLLYRMITHEVEPNMPEDGAKLDPRNIDAIAKWIDLGAPYDGSLKGVALDSSDWTETKIDPSAKSFWSFQPLNKTVAPRTENDRWSKTDIDRFVYESLTAKGMSPNALASRDKLARRMYLDVIGLPPTPQQLKGFIDDNEENAVDKLIESLLSSSHFGEKWARHWLDIARFAESHGFEQDYNRPYAYHYRDFVIKAFNQDMPFDQFVRWQIAGDELAPNEPLALMATGFLGAGVFPTQLTEKEFEPARYDELDDMASTIGTAMLGLTIGCARCHDHKFDPIPMRDYYQFISTFTTTIRTEVDLELDPELTKNKLAGWQKQNDELVSQLKKYETEGLQAPFKEWLKNPPKATAIKPGWVVLEFEKAVSKGGATFKRLDDGSYLATGKNPDFDKYEFVARTNLKGINSIRLEALADSSMVRKGPGRASNGNFGLGDFKVFARKAGTQKLTEIKLVKPRVTFEQNNSHLSIASSIDSSPKTGWAVDPQFGKNHAAIFEFQTPVSSEGETELVIKMQFDVNNKHNIGRPRISITNSPSPLSFEGDFQNQEVVEVMAILEKSNGKLTDEQRAKLFQWFRRTDAKWQEINRSLQGHIAKKPKPVTTKVMISSEGLKPLKHHADGRKFPHFYKQTHFLKRGDTTQKVAVAKPGLLQVLSAGKDVGDYRKPSPESGRLSYRRAAMVRWLTDTDNGPGQLMARVIVNRIWQHYLGRGLVETPNDFGFQGSRPSHPELLDWLAQKLIDENWSLKSIHRLILKSAVYQQASEFDADDSAKDIDNRLLWRFSPRRLEAEIIRDSMLSVSKELDSKMYGPGTLDERMKRRSIYFMIKRSRLIPMMQIFDSPEPLVSVGSRPRTTIAPQALLFMNNPNVRQYARQFAKRLLAQVPADKADGGGKGLSEQSLETLGEIVNAGFQVALARKANKIEMQQNIEFMKTQLASYKSEKKPNSVELAVTDFCQVLFCLNEFVYLD